ncbi:ribosomal protein L1 [Pholiota conissans]|uniref:Ribosomal L1 domain-containing protein 1 n=1 Tax=Pholiota conissans TaxID=109636 RepID=A0A9P5Z2G5_9AGAR|nr:ribosomal protein L1 [Pholiota conissans]
MSKGEKQPKLIDEHVSLKQCSKAVEALLSHELKKKEKFESSQLLPAKEQNVWLNVTIKTIPPGHRLKPVKIPIVHPLVDPRTSPVCLITKDPQREYKDLLEKHNIKFISRVVGLEKLKGKFKPFEARRMLLKENGMFLADDRVIPLLPKLLGSKWFEAKKQPIPVCLSRKDLKGELERAISSTYMNQNQGTCTSIKVGKMSQTPSQILDNIKSAIPAVAKAIKGNWGNIQSLNIKTNSSASLPIWTCALDDTEGGRWHGLQAEDEEDDDVEMDGESEEDEEEVKPKKGAASKGKKRPSSSDEDEPVEEKPAKKSKIVESAKGAKDKVSLTTTKPTKSTSTDAAAPTPSKKRKLVESADSSAKTTSPSVAPLAVAGKKAKSTATAHPSVPAESASKSSASEPAKKTLETPTSASPTVDAPLKKKKKSSLEEHVADSASVKTPSTPDAPSVAGKNKSGKDKTKNSQLPEVAPSDSTAASEKVVKASLTKQELKQKRSTGAGQKKKEIMLKTKGGRSAKNAVLGKKAGQE